MHNEPTTLPIPKGRSPRRKRIGAIVSLMMLASIASAPLPTSAQDRGGASLLDTVYYDIPFSLAAAQWRYGSVPGTGPVLSTSLLEVPGIHRAELHWYSPAGVVKQRDLDPALTDARGAQDSRPVLALSIPRRPVSAAPGDSLWASLTYLLDPVGLDLTRSRFIEVWVNDWRDPSIRHVGTELHIDLGTVSEDQMRAPNEPPNSRLDSEDQWPPDLLLEQAEDTGVDAVDNAAQDALLAPLDLSTASAQDLAGDDYEGPSDPFAEIDPRRWVRTNGTEGNRVAHPDPDTEDLNTNGNLDRQEDGFEYTIDLNEGDTRYLVTDVYADYPHVRTDDGWRLYRIPIDDAERVRFGVPQLPTCRHVRVWIDGIVTPDGPEDPVTHVQRPLLMLAGMRIFGWGLAGPSASTAHASMASPWPNPARGDVTLDLTVPQAQPVDLDVHDLGGRRVCRLSHGTLAAGRHRFAWDRRDAAGARVAPGLYLVELRTPGHTSAAKVLIVE